MHFTYTTYCLQASEPFSYHFLFYLASTTLKAQSFSLQMVDNFKEAFALFDVAGHGVVTTADLGRVMRAVGLTPSDDELANMITEVDGSG